MPSDFAYVFNKTQNHNKDALAAQKLENFVFLEQATIGSLRMHFSIYEIRRHQIGAES